VTEGGAIHLIVSHKSAEGKVGHVVGEAVGALHKPKGGAAKINPDFGEEKTQGCANTLPARERLLCGVLS